MHFYHITSFPGRAWFTGNRWFDVGFHLRYGWFQFEWVWFGTRHWIQVTRWR